MIERFINTKSLIEFFEKQSILDAEKSLTSIET